MLDAIDAALKRIDDGHLRDLRATAASRSAQERLEALPWTTPVHRLQAQGGAWVSEPAPRTLDVRVGSSTDALTPVSVGRALARGARRRSGSGSRAVVLAAIAADQLTKLIVSSQLALDESLHVLGPFSIHHVQNSGHRLRALRERDAGGDGADGARGRLDARLLRPLGRAASGAAGRARPADRRLRPRTSIDRVRLGHVTDFLDLRYWPAFNLADSFIVVGVAILFVALLLGERPAERRCRRLDAPRS